MKNKETLKKKLVRGYFSIKGFFDERKMKSGLYYSSENLPGSRLMYVGKRTFYRAFIKQVCPGVAYQDQDKVIYKYWEIGILNFRKS